MQCPRRSEVNSAVFKLPDEDTWRSDNTCSYCGSMNPDALMERLEAGDVELEPTDKSYKVYVRPGKKFYFQHLSEAQMKRFIELLNEKKLRLAYPGHFYTMPFFITYKKP